MKNDEYLKSKKDTLKYRSIIQNVLDAGNTSDRHPNTHIILIDGMNLFLRNFNLNPSINSQGEHVGGMLGFLRSLASLNKKFNPTRLIVVFDGKNGNSKRRAIQQEYKGERNLVKTLNRVHDMETEEDVKERLEYQLKRLPSYLLYFPIQVIVKENYEADDLIYHATNFLSQKEECEKITIVSSDKDFLQLTSDKKVDIWSPINKKIYNYTKRHEKFLDILPENLSLYRSFLGDSSDSIQGIKGIGPKTVMKLFPEMNTEVLTIDKIEEKCKQSKNNNKLKQILNEISKLRSNYQITDLKETTLNNSTERYVLEVLFQKSIDLLDKPKIKDLLIYDLSEDVIKNIDNWFQESWSSLNLFAKTYNEQFKTKH